MTSFYKKLAAALTAIAAAAILASLATFLAPHAVINKLHIGLKPLEKYGINVIAGSAIITPGYNTSIDLEYGLCKPKVEVAPTNGSILLSPSGSGFVGGPWCSFKAEMTLPPVLKMLDVKASAASVYIRRGFRVKEVVLNVDAASVEVENISVHKAEVQVNAGSADVIIKPLDNATIILRANSASAKLVILGEATVKLADINAAAVNVHGCGAGGSIIMVYANAASIEIICSKGG